MLPPPPAWLTCEWHEAGHLVHQHQVLQRPGCEEHWCVALLSGNQRGAAGLHIILIFTSALQQEAPGARRQGVASTEMGVEASNQSQPKVLGSSVKYNACCVTRRTVNN